MTPNRLREQEISVLARRNTIFILRGIILIEECILAIAFAGRRQSVNRRALTHISMKLALKPWFFLSPVSKTLVFTQKLRF